ncbi:Aste57867_14784 [Aphanomyces stellatus]|uniref:Aste57867_14784 protein n=1 Tax=Aphanomyces stellatus TaxID=120398 RepID=A0A485L3B5_9STRA|nr:hypothetical protein As57867_014729 [Aphanomyces stellatus]VFT91602.1 Aste57867_14784 [Aphanomyces stellatus]
MLARIHCRSTPLLWRRGPAALLLRRDLTGDKAERTHRALSSPSKFTLEKQKQILEVVEWAYAQQGRPKWTHLSPADFIVPSTDAWPEALHNVRFNLSLFRNERRRGLVSREIEARLDAVGFVWDLRELQWRENLRAVETYKSIHGDVLIPITFVVPAAASSSWPKDLWGKRLGSLVNRLRLQQATMPPERKKALDDLGFVWDVLALNWDVNRLALETFLAQHGHLRVPSSFVVPDHDPSWPAATWGKPLGATVATLRRDVQSIDAARRAVLDAMGFQWRLVSSSTSSSAAAAASVHHVPLATQWQVVEMATHMHTTIQGHHAFTAFPSSSFHVPEADLTWPVHLRGQQVDVRAIRRAYAAGQLDPAVVAALDAIHFVWDSRAHLWQCKMEALAIYRREYGDLLVPRTFVVPRHAPTWPVYLWDKNLGKEVNTLRDMDYVPEARRHALDAIGFVWHVQDDTWQANVAALAHFKAVYGHLCVRQHFAVRDGDMEWPDAFWGKKLGNVVSGLRQSAKSIAPERRAALDAMGFVWNAKDAAWAAKIAALTLFNAQYGHLRVHQSFVVPTGHAKWPEDLGGLALGRIVASLRRGRTTLTLERRQQLNDMGFLWHVHS